MWFHNTDFDIASKKFKMNINEHGIIILFLFYHCVALMEMMIADQQMSQLVNFAEKAFDEKKELTEANMKKFEQMIYDIIYEWRIEEWKKIVLRP